MRQHALWIGLLFAGCQEYNVKPQVPADELPPEVTTPTVELSDDDPALQITPEAYAFPTSCTDEVTLTLENVGGSDLVIDGIAYTASSDDLSLVDGNVLPLVLAPADTTTVRVAYDPELSGQAFGVVEVSSNDPRGVQAAEQAAEAGDEVVETFEVLADPPIDIVFAVDKSGSMTEEARNLGQAFGQFINEIGQVTTDWRIGVAIKDSGCFVNGIITANTPNYEAVFLDATGGLGIFGTDLTEQLLELAHVSLEQAASGCNAGFVRRDALMHVIAVSDEPEQSGQPWDYWVTQWQANKADPNLVLVSAVVDTIGDCGQYGQEYVEAAQGTGGLVLDVCSSNWGSYAQQLGSASAASLDTYLLSALPDPGTIEVTFDGDVATEGSMWTYDPVRNAVTVQVDLPDGTIVEVSYDSLGCE